MTGAGDSMGAAYRLARAVGSALCFGTPLLIAALIFFRAIPPGLHAPEGIYQELGYLFTGMVFLGAAWVPWRFERVLKAFQAAPEAARPSIILRESLTYAVIFETSSLLGLVYWILVGTQAYRHVWGFILLSPILFLALMPKLERWTGHL
jgi:hypothetical protein